MRVCCSCKLPISQHAANKKASNLHAETEFIIDSDQKPVFCKIHSQSSKTKFAIHETSLNLSLQSIFHVAFLRGLFPGENFKSTRMDNVEGVVHPWHACLIANFLLTNIVHKRSRDLIKSLIPSLPALVDAGRFLILSHSFLYFTTTGHLGSFCPMEERHGTVRAKVSKRCIIITMDCNESNAVGMEIQMLRPQCKDSQRLVDWVEKGEPILIIVLFF